jgi:hypothetical protein
MTVRNFDKTQYGRALMGSGVLATANSTTQTLIPLASGGYADIYALSVYNGTAGNTFLNVSDGTKNYTFGIGGNTQTVCWGLPVNSPISASSNGVAWTCNTGLATPITVMAWYVLNSQ